MRCYKARRLIWLLAMVLPAGVPLADMTTPAAGGAPAAQIIALASPQGALTGPIAGAKPNSGSIGLNGELRVKLNAGQSGAPAPTPAASSYVLFLNGRALTGIPPATYDPGCGCLAFALKPSAKDSALWASLLGSPTNLAVPITVSLGVATPGSTADVQPTIFGVTRDASTFSLQVISLWRLAIAILGIGAVLFLLWRHSRSNTGMRDGYLPQIAPEKQTYSLARWQMAFWFTLIFASFLFLFLLLWDYNTISTQALILMGISGGTAAGAIAVDAAKDSPADAVNRGLQALGLLTYEDVQRVRDEITGRETQLRTLLTAPAAPAATTATAQGQAWAKPPAQPTIAGLQTEIQDRLNILRTYKDKTKAYETQGWFKDITTDLNGTSLHRLQAFIWTWVLGAVFVIGVYRDLAMPEFSSTLLALMAVSSAGYVGFKIQEQNN